MFWYGFYEKIDLWAIFERFICRYPKQPLVFDALCQSNHKTVKPDNEVLVK